MCKPLTPRTTGGENVSIYYDRRVDDVLIASLKPGGWAHSLVQFGSSGQFALDLQLRGYATRSKKTWATLYVGLTKVVDLVHLPGKGLQLDAHRNYRKPTYGWRSSWEKWQPADQLRGEWDAVDLYLERVIPTIGKSFLKEGSVQAAVSGFANEHMIVIDREAAVTYANQAEKARVTSRLEGQLLRAVGEPGRASWWRTMPTHLGGECDALALGQDGTLLAIEIKPRSATSTIRWSPLQARHYANLFSEWIRRAAESDPGPIGVLNGMVQQRVQLGLIKDEVKKPKIATPLQVQPLIAIGRGYSDAALRGLQEVQERLAEAGFNDPPLRVASAALWGELTDLAI
jgi:hypothetical protein